MARRAPAIAADQAAAGERQQRDHVERAGAGAEHAVVEADRRRQRQRVEARTDAGAAQRFVERRREGEIERDGDQHERQRVGERLARGVGQGERAERRADQRREGGGGHGRRVDLAGAVKRERRRAGAEHRAELVGRHRRDRIEAGERQRRQGDQAAAAGDRVDEAGDEAGRREQREKGKGQRSGRLRAERDAPPAAAPSLAARRAQAARRRRRRGGRRRGPGGDGAASLPRFGLTPPVCRSRQESFCAIICLIAATLALAACAVMSCRLICSASANLPSSASTSARFCRMRASARGLALASRNAASASGNCLVSA